MVFLDRILILAKTYPSPSAKYVETSCVAGINEHGQFRRLYPVPFRLIEEGKQFKKWQWITARVRKSNDDHRPESHRIFIDTIECDAGSLPTKNHWEARWPWIDRIPVFSNFAEIEQQRLTTGASLALLRPKRILNLEIRTARYADWTADEKAKLVQEQMQGNLFVQAEAEQQIRELKKIPFDFYYNYVCDSPEGEVEQKHKIVDWEAGALYWNCSNNYGEKWEQPFRTKLEEDLAGKDLMFLMGNIHRFQDQWLIVSLIYPPKQRPVLNPQTPLF
ncbi:MAG: hypothetical protein K2X06_10845 [Burkholderiales bacterium]|nr:hypothetical protein [Burkholderiales bacterium]